MRKLSGKVCKTLALAAAFALITSTSPALNILVDPGFESGMPSPGDNAFGGWNPWGGAELLFSQDYAHTGVWSMKLPEGAGPSGALQYALAAPGISYTFTGWVFTPTPLSINGFGLLEIQFLDANFLQLGTVEPHTPPWLPFLDSATFNNSSPANTWIPLSVTATAPANTAYAWVQILAGTHDAPDTIYFDDLSLSPVPEPSGLALLGLGVATLAFVRCRK